MKSKRPWTAKELYYIQEYMDQEIDWQDLIFYLSDRSRDAIRSRVHLYRSSNGVWTDAERTVINRFILGHMHYDDMIDQLIHAHTTARIMAQVDRQKIDMGMKSASGRPEGYQLLQLLAMRPDKREQFMITQ